MKYTDRKEFEFNARINLKRHYAGGYTYARCLNAFWLRLEKGDVSISDNINAYGYWESWDTMAILNYINQHPTWSFIDVGANLGYYSMAACAEGAPAVYSFECNPDMVSHIAASKKQNAFNVDIREVALADKPGTATLSVPEVNLGGASLYKHDVEQNSFEVKVDTLDNQMAGVDGNFIIKVDVEGYERHVWWGAKDLRERSDNIWLVEWFNTRWTPEEQKEFLEEVTSTHKLFKTDYAGQVVGTTIDSILATEFTTLVLKKR